MPTIDLDRLELWQLTAHVGGRSFALRQPREADLAALAVVDGLRKSKEFTKLSVVEDAVRAALAPLFECPDAVAVLAGLDYSILLALYGAVDQYFLQWLALRQRQTVQAAVGELKTPAPAARSSEPAPTTVPAGGEEIVRGGLEIFAPYMLGGNRSPGPVSRSPEIGEKNAV